MSFDLGIFYSERPLTAQEAGERHVALCERSLDGQDDWEKLIEPSERITAFVAELDQRFPSLSAAGDDPDDLCPWSCDHHISPGHVIMAMRWSRAGQVAPIVTEMALRHGLIVYDPQADRISLPPHLAPSTPEPPREKKRPWWRVG